MAENPEVENRDRYKSYIQRRRVVPQSTDDASVNEDTSVSENTIVQEHFFGSEYRAKTEKSAITDVEELSLLREKYRPDEGPSVYAQKSDEKSSYTPFKFFTPKTGTGQKKDSGSYRRYGINQKWNTSYGKSYTEKRTPNYIGNGNNNNTPVEDNRTTLLAIKIIKQALACFAVLGAIVFMQQNLDMAEELSFVKKHVVDNHIELSNIVTGVEDLIAECSRIFGGSP